MNAQLNPAPILPIPVGTAVRVSDGSPQPPARFNKKLAAWKSANFDGVVVSHNEAGRYTPYASYDIQRGDLFASWIKITSSCIHPNRVQPVPGAPRYEVGTDKLVKAVIQDQDA